MLKIGITGNIGSGKSTVAKVFMALGIPVFDADKEAKKLMTESPEIKQKILDVFGTESYAHGQLNRAFISAQVFGNDEKLKQLNTIVHPATIQAGKDWMNTQTTAYAIKEAALFFESGSASDLDYIIGVQAPPPLRLQRAMLRDGSTLQQVHTRMEKQMDESLKMKLCDFVIINDEQQMLIPQVLKLHRRFMEV